jgi:hypothetical protein
LAPLGSLARHEGSVWVSFPASSPESALRRCEESQKHVVYSAQAANYLLALASDFRLAGSLVILVGPESPIALERSDSAASLSAHLAILREHFRLATVSVQESPVSPVFRLVLSENRQASRKVSFQAGLAERTSFLLHLAKHQASRKVSFQAGLVERTSFLLPLHLAKHPE